MKHVALFYDLVPDYLERRAARRDEHLGLAWAAAERGELVLGAPSRRPTRRVREWATVVGELAATPVRPAGAR